MTRFLNGPVIAIFVAAGCALTAYVLVTGAQTRPSATLTERGSSAAGSSGRDGALGSPAGRRSVGERQGRQPRSVSVAYRLPLGSSYRAEHARWKAEKAHRLRTNRKLVAEHAHVQRLLHQLRVRRPQAVAVPPHYDAWMCIHHYEGAWDANTGNGYFGGLQADLAFQRAYAPALLAAKGTADHWTPFEQMWMAERAWQTRGFSPWPTTARMCGLA